MSTNGKATSKGSSPSGASRRGLIRAAAGSVVLAVSGLLPEGLAAKAKADSHPVRAVQQRKEQRRKKQRQERDRRKVHHRRDRREGKQHRRPDALQLGPDGIKLTVNNHTSSSFQIKYWGGAVGWASQEDTLASQGVYFAGSANDLHAGIEFLTDRHPFVWVENPVSGTPNTTYQYDGSMGFFGYTGGTIDVDHGTLEQDAETTHRISFTSSSAFAIKVRREKDIPGFKVFTMTVSES
jgi:hypothetical protein